MRFLFPILLLLTFSIGAVAQNGFVIMTARSGAVDKFYEKFPMGETDLLVAAKNLSARGKVLLVLDDLTELYVAAVDTSNSQVLKQGPLPYEVARVGHYIFFKNVKLQEIDPLLHAHDLKLIKVSSQEKTFSADKKSRVATQSVQDLAAFYTHTKAQFDIPFLKDKLEQIAGIKPANLGSTTAFIKERGSAQGRENVRQFIQSELQKIGFRTWLHKYSSTGTNIVAQKDGSEAASLIVLSAHIDSVGNAGADDDGTGVAALMATAKVFSTLNHRYSLRIVGYDQEENGLVGSGAYFDEMARTAEVRNILGAIHYDMTGWDGNKDGKFHILDCNENTSPAIRTMMTSAITQLGIKLKNIPACRRRSDHIRYWQYSIPAVMAIEVREQDSDVNPCYHRACDTVDTINFDYLNNITQVGALTLMQMTEATLTK